jgi:diguanylate cyclase (GGDEF)-like protein
MHNRKAFYEEIEKCQIKALRNKNKIALFFIDIDNFKTVNDNSGT